MVIAAVIAKPLAAKFGKAEISVASNMLAGVVSLLLYLSDLKMFGFMLHCNSFAGLVWAFSRWLFGRLLPTL